MKFNVFSILNHLVFPLFLKDLLIRDNIFFLFYKVALQKKSENFVKMQSKFSKIASSSINKIFLIFLIFFPRIIHE